MKFFIKDLFSKCNQISTLKWEMCFWFLVDVYLNKIKSRMLNARETAVPDIEYLAKRQPGGWDWVTSGKC